MHPNWREESIKTRIETQVEPVLYWQVSYIEEKNPLKQGLKPKKEEAGVSPVGIEEKNPLKQGLKRCFVWIFNFDLTIEEKNPLKQGLKLSCFIPPAV